MHEPRRALAPLATLLVAAAALTAPAAAQSAPDVLLSGAVPISPKVYDELSPGNAGHGLDLGAAVTFAGGGRPWMLQGGYRRLQYPHDAFQAVDACAPATATTPGCATVVGHAAYQTGICPGSDPGCVTVVGYPRTIAYNGLGQAYVPSLALAQSEAEVRAGIGIGMPRVFAGIGYLTKSYRSLGYPRLSGVGFGITKLPDVTRRVSLGADVWYYPTISGRYTFPSSTLLGPLSGSKTTLSYAYLSFRAGGTFALGARGRRRAEPYLAFGVAGEAATARADAPSNTVTVAPYLGLGVRL